MRAERRHAPEDCPDIRVVDDVLEHHQSHRAFTGARAGDQLGDWRKRRTVHGREGSAVEMKARDGAQGLRIGDEHRHITVGTCVYLGKYGAEVLEPPFRHEEGSRSVTGADRDPDDLRALCDVQAHRWLVTGSQGDISEAHVVGEACISRVGDADDAHALRRLPAG
jgi:hypothetical protein